MGTLVTIVLAAAIIGYSYYAARKSVLDAKDGKCAGCDCSKGSCHIKED